jgi:hypothetical protein
MIAEIKASPSCLARLHEIERDIVESLAERPWRTWCHGCSRLMRRLYAKAKA